MDTQSVENGKISGEGLGGRSTRTEFWAATAIILPFKLVFITATKAATSMPELLFLVIVVLDFIWICCCIRRLHDIDRSGWWSLLALIPAIGTLVLLVWCGGTRGVEYANKWGQPIKKRKE